MGRHVAVARGPGRQLEGHYRVPSYGRSWIDGVIHLIYPSMVNLQLWLDGKHFHLLLSYTSYTHIIERILIYILGEYLYSFNFLYMDLSAIDCSRANPQTRLKDRC